MACSVFLVDDHRMLRDAVKEILLRYPEFEVVGEAANGAEAVAICEQNAPDLVVMDISLPGMSGIEAAALLLRRSPGARVLMLSMHGDEEMVMAALRAGACGFVLKKACAAELLDAMRTVARGGMYFGAQVSDRVLEGVRDRKRRVGPRPGGNALSPRERQVLRLTVEGKSNKEVAAALDLEVHTVRSYRKTMMAKLGATNVAELIQVAFASNLIER